MGSVPPPRPSRLLCPGTSRWSSPGGGAPGAAATSETGEEGAETRLNEGLTEQGEVGGRWGGYTHLSEQGHEAGGGHDADLPGQSLSNGRPPLLLAAAIWVGLETHTHTHS